MGFVGYCDACGNTEIIKRPLIDVFGHNKTVEDANGERSSLMCSTCARRGESGERSARLAVSGPLWIGSLHDRATVEAMRDEADALGWLRDDDEDASEDSTEDAEDDATEAAEAPKAEAKADDEGWTEGSDDDEWDDDWD